MTSLFYARPATDRCNSSKNPDDPVTRSRVMAAALLIMEQEALAHAVAAGHAVDPDDVVRITRATTHALAQLGLK